MEKTTEKPGECLKHNLSVAVIAEDLKCEPTWSWEPCVFFKGKTKKVTEVTYQIYAKNQD